MFVYTLSKMAQGGAAGDAAPSQVPDAERPMRGKVVLITGATSGLGLHAARAFYVLGASVVITYRNVERGKRAVEEVFGSAVPEEGQAVHMAELDLCSLRSVDAFCAEIMTVLPRLDVLVCNAGVMGMPYELTTDGVETHYQTNQLGHFVIVRKLLPLLEASAGRICVVSSGLYKQATKLLHAKEVLGECLWDYKPGVAYANSKLANCLFVKELARRLEARGSPVHAFCIRPGFIRGTELGRQTHWFLRAAASPLIWLMSSNLDKGIEPIVYCATAPVEQLTNGGLYHGHEEEQYAESVTQESAERAWRQCERIEDRVAKLSHGKVAPREFAWPLYIPPGVLVTEHGGEHEQSEAAPSTSEATPPNSPFASYSTPPSSDPTTPPELLDADESSNNMA